MNSRTTHTSRFVTALLAVVMFCAVAGSLISVQPKQTEAIVPIPMPTLYPFGGMIGFVFWCNCSDTLLILVGPPRPGTFIIDFLTTDIYLYAAFHPGAWTLGNSNIPRRCRTTVGFNGCGTLFGGLNVEMIGTSI